MSRGRAVAELTVAAAAPPDAGERARIVDELDATLFVEAGAGSGKTRSLVDRIVALVTRAAVPMRQIAAITFTDKAAAELRDRVRRELEAVERHGDEVAADRARQALHDLDGAAVSTLHAFAQRLLTEQPLQAGLPPRVEVADEVASQLAFDERWAAFVDGLLDDEALAAAPDDEQALLLLLEVRKPIEALRDVALEFERNWDLVAEQVVGMPVPPVQLLDVRDVVEEVLAVAGERIHGAEGDKLVDALAALEPLAHQLEAAETPRDQLRALHRLAAKPIGKIGNCAKCWKGGPWAGGLDPLRQQANDAIARCADAEQTLAEAALRRLTARVATFTVATAEQRRREGRLAFHDLLVLARDMLRASRLGARGPRCAARALQPAPARRVPGHRPHPGRDRVAPRRRSRRAPAVAGHLPPPLPGRLFFVGDPKQSIYRFRRADIATFLRTRQAVTDQPVHLTANFRTAEPVVGWINATFDRLIEAIDDVQPAYQPLQPVRRPTLAGPPVLALDSEHADKPLAGELRAREVRDVVTSIREALAGWEVSDGEGLPRPARPGDIAILIPSRAVLDALEDALDDADIPYRTESSSLAYASREVRDLLLALRAVDDATDELALVSTLRSALFGCTDVDLYRWRRERGGRWNLVGGQLPEPEADDPVHDAMTYLRALAAERHWTAPADLLDRLVRDRRVLEVAGTGRRSRDVWRRVRYLLDQARAWREAGGGSLREYVAWAYRQAADGVRVNEAVLPETDHDAVRIMTIHAAKGLEFPIVVVAGLTTQHRGGRAGVDVLWTADGPQVRLSPTFVTREYEATKVLDEQLDEYERRRLLYVACTRARDHLVVSLHRKAAGGGKLRSLAELIADATTGRDLHEVLVREDEGAGLGLPSGTASASARAGAGSPTDHTTSPPGATAGPGAAPDSAPAVDPARWRAEHTVMLAGSGRPRTMAATSFAAHLDPEPRALDDPGLAKGGVDLDQPPWQKGRYGTAIGRAVHAVLQTVDLATGAGLDHAAAAQAAAEGVIGREHTIAALARSALATDTVRAAAAVAGLLAGGLRGPPVRRHDAGGLRRPALPLTGGPGRGRLQDRPAGRRGPARRARRAVPAAAGRLRAGGAARHRRGGRPGDAGVLLDAGTGDGASGS